MNYQDSMSGLDQIFQSLLSQSTTPKRAMVDEMDDTFKKQDETARILEEFLSGQSSPSQQRLRAAELYESEPTDPGSPW